MIRAGRAALLIALGASHGPPARAADPPPRDPNLPSDPALTVVVTGTRTPESGSRATVRTDVITRGEAERRGATNVGEALRAQPGVQVNPSAYGHLGGVSAIQIQGFDRNRVLVLEDGERTIGDVGGAVDLAAIPLGDVARIEIVSGPVSSLYGASAIGGVVNVLTAPPEVEGASARAGVEGRSRLGVILRGSGAYRSEETWGAIDASFQRSDGVALADDQPDLALPEASRALLGLRAGTRLAGRVELSARVRWIHDETQGLESQRVPGLGVYLVDLPERTDRVALHLVETLDLGGGAAIRLSGSRQWALATTAKDRRDSSIDEARDREHGMHTFEALATLPQGSSRTFLAGARVEVERFEQHLTRTQPERGALVTTETVEVPSATLGSAALFGQLRWALGEGITILPGVRGEAHTRYGGVIAPRLAAAWSPSPEWQIRAAGGRGFRAPSAKELGYVFDHSFYGYRVQGNPDLAPETSWGVNGDVTVEPTRRLTVRAGAFANWVEELIDVDSSPAPGAGGIDEYTYRNVSRARTFGVELDAAWRVNSRLRVDAGYAYLWTRDDTHERPLEGRPPHTLTSSIQAKLPLELELTLRYRAVTDAFLDDDLRAPGFQSIDARLARALWPGSQIYTGVLNALGAQKDPARLGDQRPIEGRTIYLGAVAQLPWEG